jgi:hypothetical protein
LLSESKGVLSLDAQKTIKLTGKILKIDQSVASKVTFYVEAVTLGGVKETQKIIVDISKKIEVNLGPKFTSPLLTLDVKLTKGEDGEIEDDSIVTYKSPKAVDSEGDSIKITFDLQGNSFLSASQNTDDTFTLSVDRSKLKP